MLRKLTQLFLVAFVGLTLAACNKEAVRTQLTEDQANEMLRALLISKIDAQKLKQEKSWDVVVPKEDIVTALSVLKQYDLPRQPMRVCENNKKDSMFSSPAEELGRSICSSAQDLERTFASYDGVIVARVNVDLPRKDPMSNIVESPRAAITIKHLPGAKIDSDYIKRTTFDSISRISHENITVVLHETQPITSNRAQTTEIATSTTSPNIATWLGGLAAAVVSVGLIMMTISAFNSRRKKSTGTAIAPIKSTGDD